MSTNTDCHAVRLDAPQAGLLTEQDLLDRLLSEEAVLPERRTRVIFLVKEAVSWERFPGIPDGMRIPVVRIEEPDDDDLASDLGIEMCKKWPNTLFAATLSSDRRLWQLRSVGDFDVSEIARENGGSGHKNAAEFYRGGH